jgi:hypothetical protein
MHWTLWIVVGWVALGALLTITQVGKIRPPTTPGVAALTVVFSAVLIALVLIGGNA